MGCEIGCAAESDIRAIFSLQDPHRKTTDLVRPPPHLFISGPRAGSWRSARSYPGSSEGHCRLAFCMPIFHLGPTRTWSGLCTAIRVSMSLPPKDAGARIFWCWLGGNCSELVWPAVRSPENSRPELYQPADLMQVREDLQPRPPPRRHSGEVAGLPMRLPV